MITQAQINTIYDWIKPEIINDCYANDMMTWADDLIYVLQTNNSLELQEAQAVMDTLANSAPVTVSQVLPSYGYVAIDPALVEKINTIYNLLTRAEL
jgi:hypothetical protein